MLTREILIDLSEREGKEAAAARRFPVSVSSETPVPRRDWQTGQMFSEILSHARDAVDLSRAPLPVLESHDRSKVNVGIVTNLRTDGGRLRGELVLGASQRAGELAQDIAAGIVTGLSVGYTVDREERDEKAKRITARHWTPYEVSIVSVPADVSVGINRSAHMDPQNPQQPLAAPVADPARAADPAPEVLAERQRVTEIQSLATRHDMGEAFARDLIGRGVTLEQARALVLNRLADRDEATQIRSHLPEGELVAQRARVAPGEDLREDFRAAAIDALLLRAGIRVEKPHAAARDVSASVYDLARVCLSRSGKSASRWFGGEARGPELIKRAGATTSDFPAILEGALHASIRSGYESEPSTHRAWVRVVPFADFREAKRPILSSAPDLKQVYEGGEYTYGYFNDEGTGYKISKYGRIVGLTWEVLVNDNLGAFLRMQPALGIAARRLEADLVYSLFGENAGAGPTMADTVALFHASHANLTSSGTFGADLLSAGRALLRKQKALAADGSTGGYMNLVPRYWLVDPDHETAAETVLANASRRMTTEKSTAEWIASLELVVEPRLGSTATYLAADAGQVDTVELGLLEENIGGPHLETEQGFGTDESRWKIRHTAGVKALDFRGLVKMPITG